LDGHSGCPLGPPISMEDLPWTDPQMLLAWTEARSPALASGRTAGWSFTRTCGITSSAPKTVPVCWQGNSRVDTFSLCEHGRLVIISGVNCLSLQLYRGAKRITIYEYESGTSTASSAS
jgi:hypothetical protein